MLFIGNNGSAGGGAIASFINCSFIFHGNTRVTIEKNIATLGGAAYSETHFDVSFDGNSSVTFKSNIAFDSGRAIASYSNCPVSFNGKSTVVFYSNNASAGGGGAILSSDNCNILFKENSIAKFPNNGATQGGAIYWRVMCNITVTGDSFIDFSNNTAIQDGGVFYAINSNIMFRRMSLTKFGYNKADRNGGVTNLSKDFTVIMNSEIIFSHNSAGQFGGAIYGELIENSQSEIISNVTNGSFSNNSAPLNGSDVYIKLHASCDETCLNESIVGLFNIEHNNPPQTLVLYHPAHCTSAANVTNYLCHSYLLSNIMLGQDIKINACVFGLYNCSAHTTDFLISDNSEYHEIDGSRIVSIACETLQGIRILGTKVSNVTIAITSYESEGSMISIKLIVELSPCHPDFQYENRARRCVCYISSNIVFCSGSTSTIKEGYWFGMVDGKQTVSVCPNDYCEFTCCETTKGYYQLYPGRYNQCSSHRCGIAGGDCEEGYTLSFDSVECVSVDKCTIGQTVLVVILSMIYWIVIVILVFIATYYHVGIGYLYAITYYYSVVDILLNQIFYKSQGLFTTVSIISSTAKITPQILGQLCFVKNLSGIDQHFIHYVHPLAVTVILGIISILARISHKFSSIVSRGIIRVACFLLLISYTSVATTSLLLLRSLTFDNVDKDYTYLSPDIEYFHGRHLPYVIIAILSTLVIVIGLPLLLLLEPFLNSKVNFTRIKPLLDQFQGCHKDKYHCCAAYYMACRLVIILLVVINSSDANITQYLLAAASTIVALIQLILRPYASETLNSFEQPNCKKRVQPSSGTKFT